MKNKILALGMKAPRKLKKKVKKSLELAHKCKITIRLVSVENGIRHWEYKEKKQPIKTNI